MQEPVSIQIDPQSVRRVVRTGSILLFVLVAGTILLTSLIPYTSWLWFTHDARQPQVFTTAYGSKGQLFLIAFLVTWAVLYFNLRQAFVVSMTYLRNPDAASRAISQTMQWVQRKGQGVVKWTSPFVAFLAALGFSNEWLTFAMARNAQRFGMDDPMFGLDLGFYVFTLPWYRAIANYAVVLLGLTTALTLGLYIGLQALALLAKIQLGQPRFRLHVGLLVGFTFLAVAVQLWLKSYEYTLVESAQFTGAGYVGSQLVRVQRALAIVLAISGVATLALPKRGKAYAVPMAGGILAGAVWLVGLLAYPWAIQRLVVDPDRLNKEGPYAARAIKMTRFAYGLDKIDRRDVQVTPQPSRQEIADAKPTLDNMRLWDPEILRQALENLQGFRPYYKFHDVDVDRYRLDGQGTPVMVAPRDINLDGLDPSARNWTNLRLRYTHGYGVTMSQVDSATSDGRPVFLVDGIPSQARGSVDVKEPRLYFSDWRDARNLPTSEYALVNTGEKELDYETATSAQTHQWKGDRGIPVGGWLARFALSLFLRDGNLLVSPNVRQGSRLLMHRNVLERAERIYPFLRFDSDPYLVTIDGRLVWILDGYTLSDMMPYSARTFGQNYMRNPVKATIDAYTGEAKAYAVEPEEPLLKAYRAIYPGLVRDLSEAPEGIAQHFRYPEDLLKVQAGQLQTYHVQDPTTFLSNSDAWNIASERNIQGQRAYIRPYYVEMRLPDEPQSAFVQILPFTPNRKPNMSGWLAAHCDPGKYGRLTLYRFVGPAPDGPELMESNFNSTPEISRINRDFNNDQSTVLPGNLLIIPIGKSVMYVEPLFLQSKTTGVKAAPRLAWVVLAFADKIVVGTSYRDALARLLGSASEQPTPEKPTGTETPQPATTLPPKDALELLDQADAAMKQGDWARYGELQKRLRRALEQLVQSP